MEHGSRSQRYMRHGGRHNITIIRKPANIHNPIRGSMRVETRGDRTTLVWRAREEKGRIWWSWGLPVNKQVDIGNGKGKGETYDPSQGLSSENMMREGGLSMGKGLIGAEEGEGVGESEQEEEWGQKEGVRVVGGTEVQGDREIHMSMDKGEKEVSLLRPGNWKMRAREDNPQGESRGGRGGRGISPMSKVVRGGMRGNRGDMAERVLLKTDVGSENFDQVPSRSSKQKRKGDSSLEADMETPTSKQPRLNNDNVLNSTVEAAVQPRREQ